MKNLLLTISFLFLVTFAVSNAHAAKRGGEGVGGGDQCENRIKVIRADLRAWLQTSEPANLKFPERVEASTYTAGMIEQIDKAKIKCVGPGDEGFPVSVDGVPKTCRFDKSTWSSTITCDSAKLLGLNEEGQYGQTHHEYAGLAGFENPDGSSSNYDLSNQISYSLETVSVKKLGRVKHIAKTGMREVFGDEAKKIGTRLIETLERSEFTDCTFILIPDSIHEITSKQVIVRNPKYPQADVYNYYPARYSIQGYSDHLFIKAGSSPILQTYGAHNFTTRFNGQVLRGNFEATYFFDPSGTNIVKVFFEQTASVVYPVGPINDPGTETRLEKVSHLECHAK